MDLHRRRSVLVRMTEAGERLETVRIVNDPDRLAAVMARAGEAPEVVLEATYGWYWAAGALAGLGASVHLAHPLGVKAFTYRRVKNDERDAADLADLLRMGRLPQGLDRAAGDPRTAPAGPASRQAGRAALQRQMPGACGAGRLRSDRAEERPVRRRRIRPAGPAGAAGGVSRPDRLRRGGSWPVWTPEIDAFSARIGTRLREDAGYRGLGDPSGHRTGPGRGGPRRDRRRDPVRRPGAADQLGGADASTSRVRPAPVPRPDHPGRAADWCAGPRSRRCSAPAGTPASAGSAPGSPPAAGRNIGVVAAARELLTLVVYALRDGHVRCRQPA